MLEPKLKLEPDLSRAEAAPTDVEASAEEEAEPKSLRSREGTRMLRKVSSWDRNRLSHIAAEPKPIGLKPKQSQSRSRGAKRNSAASHSVILGPKLPEPHRSRAEASWVEAEVEPKPKLWGEASSWDQSLLA